MRQKFLFILALSTVVLLGSCKKTSTSNTCVPNYTGVPTSAEVASVQAYISSHSITATQDPGGFFYTIVNPGTGANPTTSSRVTVKYTGTLEDGSVFDQNQTGATFILSQLISGWQKGLPLIKKGGSIKLYLPPTLGYGCNAAGSIPPGSNTIFSIDLLDVQ